MRGLILVAALVIANIHTMPDRLREGSVTVSPLLPSQ
jgi:hypothetical protein